jgi:hypothetical protein
MKETRSIETTVLIYQPTCHNVLEDSNLQKHRCKNPEFHIDGRNTALLEHTFVYSRIKYLYKKSHVGKYLGRYSSYVYNKQRELFKI